MTDFDFKQLRQYPKNIYTAVIALPFILAMLMWIVDDGDAVSLAATEYRTTAVKACAAGEKSGKAGAIFGEITAEGIHYNVRTPLNYDPRIAHPLLMVYAPAGANRAKTEAMTQLTTPATKAGFIIAYADHPELSTTSTIELGMIPKTIAEKWCIDEQRIFLTGHSDGGTTAMALGFMSGNEDFPSAIAPSAAGLNYQELAQHECPKPLSVMVMHSRKDGLFPGFGVQSSGWWAACNDCDPIPDPLDNGCVAYPNCKNDVKSWYCEGEQTHSIWPGRQQQILDFFQSVKARI